VIDPGLEYSTFLGGSGFDATQGIAINGPDAYITGGTPSPDFPVTPDAVQPDKAGPEDPNDPLAQDVFLSRIDTSKSGADSLEYSTFLGGGGPDAGFGVAVTGDDAILTGATFSPNFPTTPNAFDTSFNGPFGGSDGFVARIDTGKDGPAGLEYSTYLGGPASDRGLGIDAEGPNAYLTGIAAVGFPVTGNAFDQSHNGGDDAFVTRINTNRSRNASLRYSTFLGDTAADSGRGIAVRGGHAFVTGPTQSPDFPVTGNAFDPSDNPGEDGFVSRIDTNRSGPSGLRYSTYLGGGGDDSGRAIDNVGRDAFITGLTTSPDFPVTPSAFQATHGNPSSSDAFVTRLDTRRPGLAGLEYSTYLGGGGPEDFGGTAGGIAARGNDAFVTGATASPN
jgi:hypothetical protein